MEGEQKPARTGQKRMPVRCAFLRRDSGACKGWERILRSKSSRAEGQVILHRERPDPANLLDRLNKMIVAICAIQSIELAKYL